MRRWLRSSRQTGYVAALLLAACGADIREAQGPGNNLVQGIPQAGLFQSRTIQYCFRQPTQNQYLADWQRRRNEFIGAVNATWGAEGVLNLVPSACGQGVIPVDYNATDLPPGGGGYTIGLGRANTGIFMTNDLINGSGHFEWGMNTYHTFVAAHEFGHLLGFDHEQNRPDSSCHDTQDFTGAGIVLTPYDPDSVMNYCNGAKTALSLLDRRGFRRAYAFLGGNLSPDPCTDSNDQCPGWASSGECSNNPNYMLVSCCVSCNSAGLRWISPQSGKCMDVSRRGTWDGTNIQLFSCNGSGAQSFILQDAGQGTYNIVNTNSNKCVDVQYRGTADGTNIQLYTCDGTSAQTFWFGDAGGGLVYVINTNSNKCVEVVRGGTADGTNIQLSSCIGAPNQQWRAPWIQ
jgi:hypothetical protein